MKRKFEVELHMAAKEYNAAWLEQINPAPYSFSSDRAMQSIQNIAEGRSKSRKKRAYIHYVSVWILSIALLIHALALYKSSGKDMF